LVYDRFPFSAVQIPDNNARALLHVSARDPFTEAACRTGDDCDFACELHHVSTLIGGP
jgi:hypothetical protein